MKSKERSSPAWPLIQPGRWFYRHTSGWLWWGRSVCVAQGGGSSTSPCIRTPGGLVKTPRGSHTTSPSQWVWWEPEFLTGDADIAGLGTTLGELLGIVWASVFLIISGNSLNIAQVWTREVSLFSKSTRWKQGVGQVPHPQILNHSSVRTFLHCLWTARTPWEGPQKPLVREDGELWAGWLGPKLPLEALSWL